MTRTNSDATDARTARANHRKTKLLRNLEVGDKVLFRAGSGKGTTNPTKPLTVTHSAWQRRYADPVESVEEHGADEWGYERDHSWTSHDCARCAGKGHDPTLDADEPNVTNLLRGYDADEWEVHVEGPRGGKYRLVERDGAVYHSAKSHQGLGGTILELSLEDRPDADTQAVYDDLLGAVYTEDGDREVVFEDNPDLGPDADGLVYECRVEGDEFVVRPTLRPRDLHVCDEVVVQHRGGRSHHMQFEDDYDTFVNDGVKDEVFKKGGSLDWNKAHQNCEPDDNWRWSVDRKALGYTLEHLCEEGHGPVTVEADLATNADHLDYRTGVPGIGADGRPVEGVKFREAEDAEIPEGEEVEDDEASEDEGADDTDERKKDDGEFWRMGYQICDAETVQEVKEQHKDDLSVYEFENDDDGGYEWAWFEFRADEADMDPLAYYESVEEFGYYVLDPENMPEAEAGDDDEDDGEAVGAEADASTDGGEPVAMTDGGCETVEVDRDYLRALEVLALDSMNVEGQTSREFPDRYADALVAADKANLTQPRSRRDEDEGRLMTDGGQALPPRHTWNLIYKDYEPTGHSREYDAVPDDEAERKVVGGEWFQLYYEPEATGQHGLSPSAVRAAAVALLDDGEPFLRVPYKEHTQRVVGELHHRNTPRDVAALVRVLERANLVVHAKADNRYASGANPYGLRVMRKRGTTGAESTKRDTSTWWSQVGIGRSEYK